MRSEWSFLWASALLTAIPAQELLVTKEFCNMETFNASCTKDEVIMVQEARYGRMRIGRCVKQNLGFVGCAVDVRTFLDLRCSGRQKCTFAIPNPVLHGKKPCPEDTTPYLEVSYKCIRVSQSKGPPPLCHDHKPVLLTDTSGYISSEQTTLYNVGTNRCPWKIQVAPGQRLNFTMYNFLGSGSDLMGDTEDETTLFRPDICYEYASLKEGGLDRSVSLCGGENRMFFLSTSTSNEVEVSVVQAKILQSLAPLLLKYEAIGCPDLPQPRGGRLARKGDNVTVTCENSHEIWYLTCKGTKWQGQMGNCSKGLTSASVFDQQSDFPFGILLVVAIGVALGVFLGGLLLVLAVIYMKRKHRRYSQDEFHPSGTLGPRHYSDHKTAMMINIHSEDSPHWDHVSKSLDSEDTLLRDPTACRTCAVPHSQQMIVALGAPPGERHHGNITGPADVPMCYTDAVPSRQHIYECPKFS